MSAAYWQIGGTVEVVNKEGQDFAVREIESGIEDGEVNAVWHAAILLQLFGSWLSRQTVTVTVSKLRNTPSASQGQKYLGNTCRL